MIYVVSMVIFFILTIPIRWCRCRVRPVVLPRPTSCGRMRRQRPPRRTRSPAQRGDAALLEYTLRFDGFDASDVAQLEIPPPALVKAFNDIPAQLRQALERAAQRVELFHEHQKESSWQYSEENGTRLGQRLTPLDRVGVYVPGGTLSMKNWPSSSVTVPSLVPSRAMLALTSGVPLALSVTVPVILPLPAQAAMLARARRHVATKASRQWVFRSIDSSSL